MPNVRTILVLALPLLASCASGGGPKAAVTRPMPKGVVVQGSIDRYVVTGSTTQEVTRGLRAVQTQEGGFAGHYISSWRWSYRMSEGGTKAGCRLNAVRIDLISRIRVPDWKAPPDAPSELVKSWEEFSLALDNHERKHENIAIQMAGDLVNKLEHMQDLSCRQLGLDASREAKLLLDRMQEQQVKLDTDSQHGVLEGARWPPARRPPG